MAKSLFAILPMTLMALLLTQVVFAACDTTNIPGYYEGRYIDNNDGTITDNMTKLMWMKCDLDVPWNNINKVCQYNDQVAGGGSGRIKYSWQEALNNAQNTNTTGFAQLFDWRLPNIKELTSILAPHCLSTNQITAFDTDYFDGTAATYWSSTPHRNTTPTDPPINRAWKVSFKLDSEFGAQPFAIDQKYNVRLVRDTISQ